jgi:hypothetical protein
MMDIELKLEKPLRRHAVWSAIVMGLAYALGTVHSKRTEHIADSNRRSLAHAAILCYARRTQGSVHFDRYRNIRPTGVRVPEESAVWWYGSTSTYVSGFDARHRSSCSCGQLRHCTGHKLRLMVSSWSIGMAEYTRSRRGLSKLGPKSPVNSVILPQSV